MARKGKPPPVEVLVISDIGTPEIHRQFPVIIEDVMTDNKKKTRRATVLDHPLPYYKKRKEINLGQFHAGIFLLQDYEVSHQHKTAFSSMRSELGISVSVMPDPENPHTAMERFRNALKKLPPVAVKLAWAVIIEGMLVSEVRYLFPSWTKQNNGMDRFREVLDQLLEFYEQDAKEAEERKQRERETRQRGLEQTFRP